tara:strand:- start:45216 stop:46088 length:873 start_codon:yes stop_codon:yes gene_type:complete
MSIRNLWTFFIVAMAALLQGCFGGSEEDPNANGLGGTGDYEVCSYTDNLDSEGYGSARMTYPCDLSEGPFPSTTLTGGFTNTKEQMVWLSEHLTSHGYVVLTITPTNILANPPTWKTAHLAGFAQLQSENERAASPLRNKIAQDKRAIMGFSMGGGGTLLAAGELGEGFGTAIALAPYLGLREPDYANIKEPMLVLGSAEDLLAPASSVSSYYYTLPTSITRAIAIFRDSDHLDWFGSGEQTEKSKFKVMITAWLNLHLKGDASARGYFDGAEHAEHEANDWFTEYDFRP